MGNPCFLVPGIKFVEAKVLVEQEAFFAVNNGPEMAQKLSELEVFERYDLVSAAIKNYIGKNRDATNTIIDDLHLIWKN